MRLYAATGDGIVRLDEAGDGWTVERFLDGSGAQCLAVDPRDPDIVFAGLRERGVSHAQLDQMTRTNAARLFSAAADGGY